MSFRTKPGFTIVELLIVVVVIAILATITVISFNGIRQRAETAAIEQGLVDTSKQMEVQKIVSNDSYTPAFFQPYLNKEDQLSFIRFRYGTPTTYCLDSTLKSSNTVTSHIVKNTVGTDTNAGACPDSTSISDPRCVAGEVSLIIRQQNDLPLAATIAIDTAYGTATSGSINPGSNYTRTFTTRVTSIPRDIATITLTSSGETSVRYVAVPLFSC